MNWMDFISWGGYPLAIATFFYGKYLGSKIQRFESEEGEQKAGVKFIKDIELYKAKKRELNEKDLWDLYNRNVSD